MTRADDATSDAVASILHTAKEIKFVLELNRVKVFDGRLVAHLINF